MYRRSKQARLLTGGLIGALPVTTPGDEHWNDVTLLLDGEATPIVDTSSNTSSNVAVGTSVSRSTTIYKNGSGSIEFTADNSTNYVSATFPELDGDFTIELWAKPKSTSTSSQFLMDGRAAATNYPLLYINNSNQISFWQGGTQRIASSAISNTNWKHVALVRAGTTLTLYVDGASVGTYDEGTVQTWASGTVYIGRRYAASGSNYLSFDGYIDDIRITKGVARYTADFTPPTASFLTNAPVVGRRGVGTEATLRTRGFIGAAPAVGGIDPTDHFKAITYTGDGSSSKAVTGVGFEPGFIWAKRRDEISAGVSTSHAVFDVLRGSTKRLRTDTDDEEVTQNGVLSFDADGFTLGDNFGVNSNGGTMVAWCLKAGGAGVTNTDGSITSTVTVSANVDAGFSIVKFSGGTGTVGHGLSQAPELIIEKKTNATSDWRTQYTVVDGSHDYMLLNDDVTPTNSSKSSPTNTVFESNFGSNNVIAYCFHSVEGFSKIGSYTGNGGSGNYIETGFRPAFVMIKREDVANNWTILDNVRETTNPRQLRLRPNLSDAEDLSTGISTDFDDTGFTLEAGGGHTNASGGTYLYLAFAESNTTSGPGRGMLTLYDRYVDTLT